MGISGMEFLLTCLASVWMMILLNPAAFAAPVLPFTPDPNLDMTSPNTTSSTDDVVTNTTFTKKELDKLTFEQSVLFGVVTFIVVVAFFVTVAICSKQNEIEGEDPGNLRPPLPSPPRPTRRLMPNPKRYGDILPEDIAAIPLDHPFWRELNAKRDVWIAAKKERVERLNRVRVMSPKYITTQV